jgi:trans-aconitate methyltransferase
VLQAGYLERMARTVTGTAPAPAADGWVAGDAYEAYMGRWSRPLARQFVAWLGPAPGGRWLEIGCGTGALTSAVCGLGEPAAVLACDPSRSFVAHARRRVPDGRAVRGVAG